MFAMSQERKPVITPDQVGVVTRLMNTLRLVWRLLTDARVPGLTKLIVPAALVYVLFPIDVVPDLILGLGQLDDLGILALAMTLFIELCPPAVVEEHRRALAAHASANDAPDENVIDGSFREVRDDDSK
jgi:uncharacterized membrane protein YkvA (DUF1232 family)